MKVVEIFLIISSSEKVDVDKGYKLPHLVEVAITLKFIEQRNNTEDRTKLYSFKSLTEAISRYLNNDTKETPDGKKVYKSKRLKSIPLKMMTFMQSITNGDRLDLLSNQYYGSLLIGGL